MNIYLIGGGGFSLEVLEALNEAHPNLVLSGVFDDDTRLSRQNSTGAPYLGTIEEFVCNTPPDSLYIIAIGDNAVRRTLDRRFSTEGKRPFTVVHPSASVSPRAVLAEGVYVGAFAFVGPCVSIGRHGIVNVGASVGHHAVLGDYVQICPGARVSGFAQIGEGAFLASNAVVPPSGIVGKEGKVAANSFAARKVADHQLVVGVPAKPV